MAGFMQSFILRPTSALQLKNSRRKYLSGFSFLRHSSAFLRHSRPPLGHRISAPGVSSSSSTTSGKRSCVDSLVGFGVAGSPVVFGVARSRVDDDGVDAGGPVVVDPGPLEDVDAGGGPVVVDPGPLDDVDVGGFVVVDPGGFLVVDLGGLVVVDAGPLVDVDAGSVVVVVGPLLDRGRGDRTSRHVVWSKSSGTATGRELGEDPSGSGKVSSEGPVGFSRASPRPKIPGACEGDRASSGNSSGTPVRSLLRPASPETSRQRTARSSQFETFRVRQRS